MSVRVEDTVQISFGDAIFISDQEFCSKFHIHIPSHLYYISKKTNVRITSSNTMQTSTPCNVHWRRRLVVLYSFVSWSVAVRKIDPTTERKLTFSIFLLSYSFIVTQCKCSLLATTRSTICQKLETSMALSRANKLVSSLFFRVTT